MADDQGWGDMAYNGHPVLKTPNFDAMAAEALRFDRFYAAAPVCSPTRGSVMTGRHPNRFGCFKWGYTLRPQEITVAEALKKAGYVTGHFGKWHLGSVHKGSPVNPGASGFDEWFSAPNYFDNDPILSREGRAVQTTGESSMVTVDAALEFIRKHAVSSKPFLAVVWFGSPHNPHRAIEQDRSLYDDPKKQDFYGEITGMDRAFGKLRAELRTLGIRDNTILWYCSDNGGLPNLGTTGGRGHKGQIYEGGLRVPAILEWPVRIPRPRTTNMPCNTCDIYPTLLEIADVRMKNQPLLDGISITPLIEGRSDLGSGGEKAVRSKPMGFWDYSIKGISTPSDKWMSELLEEQKAGREPQDKLRLNLDAGEIKQQYPVDSFPGHSAWLDWPWKLHRIEGKSEKVNLELYNLADDTGEEKDLLEREPDRVKSMKAGLEQWLVSVVRSLNGEDY
ncbi:MAG: N-acetylgalactosamine 6-sulfate sulfatase [Lentisphaerae bacterium RIFOXYA12_FULL_48_11]|nr:MAG: N-acetylgalactosamine 6-sulfate sulfatase [Lentisphaerae bacterium RIFOXYA12_FULL_48_11]